MNDPKTPQPSEKYNIERRIRSLRERHERQRINLASLQIAYDMLGDEIQRAEEELARAG